MSGGGFQGRDQTQGAGRRVKVSLVPVALETQSSFVLCPVDSSTSQSPGKPCPSQAISKADGPDSEGFQERRETFRGAQTCVQDGH